jgi:hypothetical protein
VNTAAFDPGKLAILYYFGDLQYWKLPSLAVEALVNGYDGPALRKLAGLSISTQPAKALVRGDLASEEIDSAFREMGVAAPLSQREAGLSLATEAARRAIDGDGSVFDEATHIRIHILWEQSIPELLQIAELSLQAKSAPRSQWAAIEEELRVAMSSFLSSRK